MPIVVKYPLLDSAHWVQLILYQVGKVVGVSGIDLPRDDQITRRSPVAADSRGGAESVFPLDRKVTLIAVRIKSRPPRGPR